MEELNSCGRIEGESKKWSWVKMLVDFFKGGRFSVIIEAGW